MKKILLFIFLFSFKSLIAQKHNDTSLHVSVGLSVDMIKERQKKINRFAKILNKSVNYLAGTPENPIEKPYGLITIGAKALF